jgi:hypothetical protein
VTTLASPEKASFGWDEWLPGVALPIACILVDYAIGEYVFRIAPAALVALAMIGTAALALSRQPGLSGLIAIGPIWLCGVVAAIVGVALTILVCVGVPLSIPMLPLFGLHVLAFFPLAVLATTPVCTAAVYFMRGCALTKTGAATYGTPKTVAVALIGAVVVGAVVLAADASDRRWVNAKIEALDKSAPETWPATLASLNAYPLCGRERCKQMVCGRLFRQFSETPPGGLATTPNAPAQYDAIFKRTYGVSIRDACKRYD